MAVVWSTRYEGRAKRAPQIPQRGELSRGVEDRSSPQSETFSGDSAKVRKAELVSKERPTLKRVHRQALRYVSEAWQRGGEDGCNFKMPQKAGKPRWNRRKDEVGAPRGVSKDGVSQTSPR